ncbi:hypothetical protein VNO77_41409 [Canavalia gladiata]|uniref:AP2/ERF domain-containing protein n=1 Tax=Canavalia gladiata TaxID=3824 RepID=A0AAN9PQ81_CANGL
MSWRSRMHGTTTNGNNKKLKGVRRRKWGKWVSEIRVPGTQERLWLGTYATAEAAAVAHDVAVFCLKRPSTLDKLNFPEILSSYCVHHRDMSPRSVQKVASEAGMDVDARNIINIGAGKTSTVAETNYENEKKTLEDDHVRNGAVCNGGAAGDVSWWDDDWDVCSEDYGEGKGLSISIEDYL